jgi:hypothetical protein
MEDLLRLKSASISSEQLERHGSISISGSTLLAFFTFPTT